MKSMYTTFRVANEMIDHAPELVKAQIEWAARKRPKSVKKGWIRRNTTVKVGYNGDDFVKNLKTVLIHYEWIKTPRIARLKAGK